MGRTWRLASKIHIWLFQTHARAWLPHSPLTCIHTNTHKHTHIAKCVYMYMSALAHMHVYMWRPKLTLDVFLSHSLPCSLKLGPFKSPALTIQLVEQAPHKVGSPVSASQPCETCWIGLPGWLFHSHQTQSSSPYHLISPSLLLPMFHVMKCGLAESYYNVWGVIIKKELAKNTLCQPDFLILLQYS